MSIYPAQKLIVVHVWKTGGTSLAATLRDQYGFQAAKMPQLARQLRTRLLRKPDPFGKHTYALDIRNYLESDFDNYFKVGFVRNPWDWLVSWYSFVQTTSRSPDSGRVWRHHLYAQIKDLSFPQFIDWVTKKDGLSMARSRQTSAFASKPKLQQRDWLSDNNGEIIVDFVGHYESLPQDFNHICNRLNLPKAVLARTNTSSRSHYRDYYSSALRNQVAAYFSSDIDEFGYDF